MESAQFKEYYRDWFAARKKKGLYCRRKYASSAAAAAASKYLIEMETTMTTIEEHSSLLLPDEITIEILSRLPAESVMRCKRVCKIWRAFIVDPAFINMHTRRSISYYTKNTTAAETEWVIFPRKRICPERVIPYGFDYQLQFVEYNNNNDNNHNKDDEKINPIKPSKPINYRPITNTHHPSSYLSTFMNIGSCNGLIFMITYDNNMFVCNPFTREYIDLPPRFNMDIEMMRIGMASGFGYHCSANEYKVVIIHYRAFSKAHVTIYTLGSGGWRDIGEISHMLSDGATRTSGGVFFNGALYWLTRQKDEIVSFDLADEEFRIVPSPPSQSQSPPYHSPSYLGLLGGCLYVTRRGIEDPPPAKPPSTDIWVMDSKEYTWSKKFNISWKSGLSYHRPLALLESGRILLHECGKPFVSYDPETESSISVDESKFPLLYTYRKTIVSLKALGETDATILDPDVCESLHLDFIENRKREEEAESAEREKENRNSVKVKFFYYYL